MPRQRMIKPEFFTSDSLAELHPMARYLFIGLWVIADDSGNLKYNPRKIRLQVFPFDDISDKTIAGQLSALEGVGCIYGYEVDGERYITIPNFATYQTINRPSKTTIPCPKNVANKHQIRAWFDGGKPVENIPVHGVLNEHSMSTHSKEVSKEGSISTYNTSFLPTGSVGGGVEDHPPTPTKDVNKEIFDEVDEMYPDAIPCPKEILDKMKGGAA